MGHQLDPHVRDGQGRDHDTAAVGVRGVEVLLVNGVDQWDVGRVVRWTATDPQYLAAADAAELKQIRAICPHLDAAARHVHDFAEMLRHLRGDQLPEWMDRVLADDLPALHSLVSGLRRDFDAVTAGLSTPWSSGQAESHVTRVKLLKRVAYGRADLDLLRQRVLLSP